MSEKLTREQQQKLDMEELLKLPHFLRFVFELIQRSGVLAGETADGSVERTFISIGRRKLGLEILDMVEIGQPVAHPDKLPILTLLQVLREEANSQPTENRNEKSSRYDRTADVFSDQPDEDDADRA